MPPDEGQNEVKGKSKSKLLIILPLLIVLLGAGGAGAYFKFMKGHDDEHGAAEKKKPVETAVYEMDTFMVNLADEGGKRFLKATIKLRVDSAEVAEECKSRNFELRDLVLTLLTSKESAEVISPDDKLNLKKQVMETVNRTLRKGHALDVYFTEFLVQ